MQQTTVHFTHTPHDITSRSSAPVTIDEAKCIADKG